MPPDASLAGDAGHIPRTESEIAAAAATLDLVVPAACMPGVMANLAVLADHAAVMLGAAA